MEPCEYYLLKEFLYQAIFVPFGVPIPSKDIVEKDELQVYIKDFGKQKDDLALAAVVNGEIVGAVWARIMDDYGHIDNDTPSLAISLYKEFRGQGIGTAMMNKIIFILKQRGYKCVSLAVQKKNYAVKMYENVGFATVSENDEEFIMVKEL